MTNHYHLLIETPEANLSRAIKWLNGSYATYVNTKRQKGGHLFQGRFKSIIVEADEYLKHLSCYIYLNPVRAKMVQTPSDYQWCGYCAFFISSQALPGNQKVIYANKLNSKQRPLLRPDLFPH